MSDQDAPQCKACFEFMPASFRDFPLCIACYATRYRARQNRATYKQPSYRTALQALEETHGTV